jgi:hypothetical protein
MKLYSLFWIILCGFQIALAEKPEIVETKVIKRSFDVASNADLKITNRYGNVNLTTWDQNKVDFHIEIQVDGKDAQRVKDRLNSISINFSSSKSLVSAETIIENIRNSNNINITIHYFVKLPKNNNLYIRNQYGNIDIDNLKGATNLKLQYGNFSARKLENPVNLWDFEYVTKANVDFVQSATMDLSYSKMEIGKSELLNIKSKYTDVSIGEVHDLINNSSYGDLNVHTVHAITNSANYSNVKIDHLNNSFVSKGNYGSVSIKNIKKGFNKISILSNYLSVNLGIAADAGYKLEGSFSYGSMSFPSNINLSKEIKKGTSAIYEGMAGNGSGEILMTMSYGNAKINLTK